MQPDRYGIGDASAKSESISKSIEILKDNSNIMLPLTQGMLNSLRKIEESIAGLGNLISRSATFMNGGPRFQDSAQRQP